MLVVAKGYAQPRQYPLGSTLYLILSRPPTHPEIVRIAVAIMTDSILPSVTCLQAARVANFSMLSNLVENSKRDMLSCGVHVVATNEEG